MPEERIQQLQQYDRRIFDLNKEIIIYKLTKLDMALQRCNIRISNYVSTTDGKSYQEVVRLISEGKTSPDELVKVIHGRTVNNFFWRKTQFEKDAVQLRCSPKPYEKSRPEVISLSGSFGNRLF